MVATVLVVCGYAVELPVTLGTKPNNWSTNNYSNESAPATPPLAARLIFGLPRDQTHQSHVPGAADVFREEKQRNFLRESLSSRFLMGTCRLALFKTICL